MLNTLPVLVQEMFHRYVHRPLARREYRRHEQPYVVTTKDGLRFELDPHQVIDEEIATDGIYERRFLRLFETAFIASGWNGFRQG